MKIKSERTLMNRKPDLAREWDYEKNEGLTPEDVTISSDKKVWWKCGRGHSWKTAVSNRSRSYGSDCPYCSRKLLILGETDLLTRRPDLAAEWDCDKNKGLKPEDVAEFSNKKVWWKCGRGHSWEAAVSSRSMGHNCHYCTGYRPIVGETDLVTRRPDLADEWDCDKNKDLKPEDVAEFSNKKVWWKCGRGHSWEVAVCNRSTGRNCPYCSGRFPILGETDLATRRPDLAAEWDCDKNKGIRPEDVTEFSGKKAWWKCGRGHSWKAAVCNRSYGNSCPYCYGSLPILGETDLVTRRPDLAAEWDCDKNKGLKAEDVTAFSTKKVWWKCKRGHSWTATVKNRSYGNGCPYCSGMSPMLGETDLLTRQPDLAAEWDCDKNKGLKPEDVAEFSNKKIWWKCGRGHSWEAAVCNRSCGSGCPYCTGQRPIVGETDLVTRRPNLATEWDCDKNKGLKPEDVTEFSNKKVWWKCKNGHSWEARIADRSGGTGCPYCNKGKKRKPTQRKEAQGNAHELS